MKKLLWIVLLAVLISSAFAAPLGFIFTNTSEPHSIGNGDIKATKKCSLENTGWLGMFAMGDASIERAALKAGISNVKYIDKETLFVLGGLFWKETIVVHGN